MKEKSYSPTFDCVWIAANLLLCSVAFSQSPTHADVTYGAGQEVVDMYLAKSPAPTPIYIWGHSYRFLSSIKRLSLAEYFRLFVCAVLSWQFTLRMLMPPIRLSLLTSSGFIDYERSFFRSVTHLDLGDVKDMSLGLLQPNP